MPTFTSHRPGTPCWVDLMSPDVDASVAFYRSVFGWEAEDQLDDEGNRIYVMFRLDGHDVAGLGGQMVDAGAMPAIWNSYVAADDLDAVVAATTEAGGTVVMPAMEVMTAGSMAVLADPSGAMISVWKAGDHIGSGICNEPNTYAWNELVTRDLDAVTPFYSKVFGWTYAVQSMGPAGDYTVVEGGENNGLAGMMAMPAEMPDQVPNHWMVYFTVADLDAALARVGDAGGQVPAGQNEVPGVGRMAVVHDPQGGTFSVMQPES